MAAPALDTSVDMVKAALARLPTQFQSKPRIAAIVSSIVAPLQTVRNTLQAIYLQRVLANATGVQLDLLGKLVALARAGLSDDDYRVRISVKILVDRSNGTMPSIIKIARTFVGGTAAGGNVMFLNQGTAAFVVRLHKLPLDPDPTNALVTFLQNAAEAGVRAILEASSFDDTALLYWDAGHWDVNDYADAFDATHLDS